METDSTRALPSEVKIQDKPNKPAFQGGLRLQLLSLKLANNNGVWSQWCSTAGFLLNSSVVTVHRSLLRQTGELFSCTGNSFQRSGAPVQDNAGTKGKHFFLLKDASIFPHNLYYQPKCLGLSVRSYLWNRHGACTSKACGTTGQIRHRYQVMVLITNASSQELFIHSELNPSLHNSGKKPLKMEELLKCVRKGFINIIINI